MKKSRVRLQNDNLLANKKLQDDKRYKAYAERENERNYEKQYHQQVSAKQREENDKKARLKNSYKEMMINTLTRQAKDDRSRKENELRNQKSDLNLTGMNLPSYSDSRTMSCYSCKKPYPQGQLSAKKVKK
jgi:hypothetical protein